MVAGLFTGLVGGGLNLADRLFNKKKYSWQNADYSNISLTLQQLQALPPSPQRDAAIQQLAAGQIPVLNDQSLNAYGSLMPAISAYEPINNQLINQLSGPNGLAYKLETQAGNNPYLTYYGKPGETEARLNDIKQRDVNAAFDEFGTKGSEALGRMGQVMSKNAQTGMLNSGYNRRQLESERMRLQQAKNEALAQGEKFVQGNMQQVFSNYNDGLRGLTASLNAAGDAYKTAGVLARTPFDMKKDAATELGNSYRQTLKAQTDLEGQARDEQMKRNEYNNNIANAMAKANYERDIGTAEANFTGQTNARMNTPSPIQSFMQGFGGAAPYGSYLGNLGGGGSGGSGGGGLFSGLLGGGNKSSNNSGGGSFFGGGNSGNSGYGSGWSGGYGNSGSGNGGNSGWSGGYNSGGYGGSGSYNSGSYGGNIGDNYNGRFWNS